MIWIALSKSNITDVEKLNDIVECRDKDVNLLHCCM